MGAAAPITSRLALSLLALFPLFLLSAHVAKARITGPDRKYSCGFRGTSGAAQQASFADLPWWEVFKDEG